MRVARRPVLAVAAVLLVVAAGLSLSFRPAAAEAPANDAFLRTWERTDKPVADLLVNRTWIWGPWANTPGLFEYYVGAEGDQRFVQYYDKSRMEYGTPGTEQAGEWTVTNGLLPKELITGQMQFGDDDFVQYPAAQVNVAGDPTDTNVPTYAAMASRLDDTPSAVDAVVIATIDRNGQRATDDAFASYGVVGAQFVLETEHTVASVFWEFMNSSGMIYENGAFGEGALFENDFFATGFPISEAFWTRIQVNGQLTDVLLQVFERRVMTYTPSNPDGWKVETGNVGAHYYQWRYVQLGVGAGGPSGPTPTPTPSPTPSPTPTPTPTMPPDCVACQLEFGRGEIGQRGDAPIGQDAFSELTQPYLQVPESHEIDPVVYGRSPRARINFQKTISLVSDFSPSKQLYYVVDWNDGSAHVSGLIDAHIGIFISHIWTGRGEYWVKVWAIDPATDIRTPVATFNMIVE